MIYLNPLNFILCYMLMILLFVYLVKIWAICSNDLPKSSEFYTVLYADDTSLCLSRKNLGHLQHMANMELIKVDSWLRPNELSINCTKSTFMKLVRSK